MQCGAGLAEGKGSDVGWDQRALWAVRAHAVHLCTHPALPLVPQLWGGILGSVLQQ